MKRGRRASAVVMPEDGWAETPLASDALADPVESEASVDVAATTPTDVLDRAAVPSPGGRPLDELFLDIGELPAPPLPSPQTGDDALRQQTVAETAREEARSVEDVRTRVVEAEPTRALEAEPLHSAEVAARQEAAQAPLATENEKLHVVREVARPLASEDAAVEAKRATVAALEEAASARLEAEQLREQLDAVSRPLTDPADERGRANASRRGSVRRWPVAAGVVVLTLVIVAGGGGAVRPSEPVATLSSTSGISGQPLEAASSAATERARRLREAQRRAEQRVRARRERAQRVARSRAAAAAAARRSVARATAPVTRVSQPVAVSPAPVRSVPQRPRRSVTTSEFLP